MNTFTGRIFDPLKMTKKDVCVEDIAHALSLICRGGGHIRYFFSVAQHSMNCADEAAARAFGAIKKDCPIPLVADIHFDYRLALECVAAGIDKVRINPGNIGDKSRVRAVVKACKSKNIPIRIGVNSGSLEKELLEKYPEHREVILRLTRE